MSDWGSITQGTKFPNRMIVFGDNGIKVDLSGAMDEGTANPARAGMQQR
jgi:hypothetical protein